MKEILIIKFDGVLSSAHISETLNALVTKVNVHDLEAISKLYNRYDIYVLRDGRYLNKALSLDCTILNQYVGNYIIYDSQEELDNFIKGIISTCENFVYVGCSDEDAEIFSNISEAVSISSNVKSVASFPPFGILICFFLGFCLPCLIVTSLYHVNLYLQAYS